MSVVRAAWKMSENESIRKMFVLVCNDASVQGAAKKRILRTKSGNSHRGEEHTAMNSVNMAMSLMWMSLSCVEWSVMRFDEMKCTMMLEQSKRILWPKL